MRSTRTCGTQRGSAAQVPFLLRGILGRGPQRPGVMARQDTSIAAAAGVGTPSASLVRQCGTTSEVTP